MPRNPFTSNDTPVTLAFRQLLRGGEKSLSTEHRTVLQNEHRALSSITGANGGYLIPQSLMGKWVVALKRFSAMAEICDIIPSNTGDPLPIPSVNDTANPGVVTAENAASPTNDPTGTPGDPVWGQAVLNSWNYESGVVTCPVALTQDGYDFENQLFQMLAVRVGRKLNTDCTGGNGTAKATGIVGGATLGVTAAGAAAITHDELIDLEHSVDAEFRASPQCGYQVNDATLKYLRKLKDSSNRPLFIANGRGTRSPDPTRVAGTLNGWPCLVNNDLATMATGAKTVLFGDYSHYKIRLARDVQIFVMLERFADKLQIGYRALCRADGKLVDAGTNPVKYLQQA